MFQPLPCFRYRQTRSYLTGDGASFPFWFSIESGGSLLERVNLAQQLRVAEGLGTCFQASDLMVFIFRPGHRTTVTRAGLLLSGVGFLKDANHFPRQIAIASKRFSSLLNLPHNFTAHKDQVLYVERCFLSRCS